VPVAAPLLPLMKAVQFCLHEPWRLLLLPLQHQ
jgi:hypothetical protein